MENHIYIYIYIYIYTDQMSPKRVRHTARTDRMIGAGESDSVSPAAAEAKSAANDPK